MAQLLPLRKVLEDHSLSPSIESSSGSSGGFALSALEEVAKTKPELKEPR